MGWFSLNILIEIPPDDVFTPHVIKISQFVTNLEKVTNCENTAIEDPS